MKGQRKGYNIDDILLDDSRSFIPMKIVKKSMVAHSHRESYPQ